MLEPYRQKYPKVFQYAEILVDRLYSYGKHAAGMVVSTDEPLDEPPRRFHDEAAAFEFVEAALWPNGPICHHCGGYERISAITPNDQRQPNWTARMPPRKNCGMHLRLLRPLASLGRSQIS